MLMTIDCPSCGEPLQVPENASGRRAKCNHCNGRFVVPSAEDLLESTVSHFALDEMDQRRREHRYEEAGGSGVAAMAEAVASLRRRTLRRRPLRGHDPGHLRGVAEPRGGRSGRHRGGCPAHGRPARRFGRRDACSKRTTAARRRRSGYPQDLAGPGMRPHLVVRRVSVDGVLLAFDAKWLHHDRFRLSMPVRSAFNGEPDPKKLTARPMVFLDAVEDPAPRARPIELRYEHEAVHQSTPEAMQDAMGCLRGVRSPFDRPILYYAHAEGSVPAMACRVRSLGDERDAQVCEVLVPHGRVAADWLAAVNGRCGEDHPRLRAEVESIGQTAWDAVPQQVRLKLEPWCSFQRGERFLGYFNDPDFSSSEAGLAGVVLTDKRLIYHKYRRLRSLSLHSPATLHLRKDGAVTRLTVTAGERRAKAGKMPHARSPSSCTPCPRATGSPSTPRTWASAAGRCDGLCSVPVHLRGPSLQRRSDAHVLENPQRHLSVSAHRISRNSAVFSRSDAGCHALQGVTKPGPQPGETHPRAGVAPDAGPRR